MRKVAYLITLKQASNHFPDFNERLLAETFQIKVVLIKRLALKVSSLMFFLFNLISTFEVGGEGVGCKNKLVFDLVNGGKKNI